MDNSFRLKLKTWGVRGSIPTPRTENLGYGGNTPCLEVRTRKGEIMVFDAGTGIYPLGVSLAEDSREENVSIQVFLTHFHWDHLQGLPFFEPLHHSQNQVTLLAPGFGKDPAEILKQQMAPPFFPVEFDLFPAKPEVLCIDKTPIRSGEAVVYPFPLNHPQKAMGYRIESNGSVIVYASDFEHGDRQLDRIIRDYAAGADLLVIDAHYTPHEYEAARGWGHSTWLEATRVSKDCAVKQLVLFHHHPSHTDQMLSEILNAARFHFENTVIAEEGSEILT